MKEADLYEIEKRNILSNANFRCEACGARIGYGKDEERPRFYYIVPILQGGERKETNVAVLCPKDSDRFRELSREDLLRKAMYREVAEPDT